MNSPPPTPPPPPSPSPSPSLSLENTSPITQPILSLATHPEFIAPLSAVLKAGQLAPGRHYSPSPTIARLSSILINHHSKLQSNNSTYEQQQTHVNESNSNSPLLQSNPSLMSSPNFLPSLLDLSQQSTSIKALSYHQQKAQSNDLSSSSSSSSCSTVGKDNSKDQKWPQVDQLINDFEEPESFMKPKYPLVLCHGLFGFDILGPQALGLTYFRGVREALEKRGVEVHVAKVPSIASIEERAKTLAQFIETKLPGKTVNLIGHSMGGLDSRFMITHLKPTSFKVASLTTIATPHRGSAFADHVMLDMIGIENLPKLLNMTTALGIQGRGQAFEDLTVKKMKKFNDLTPDDATVQYYSYGAIFQPSFGSLFKLSWHVIYEREGPNDGLVSLSSAKWANYLGTLNNVNHADLVGWTEPWRVISHPHGKSGFKVIPFYLKVIDQLARNGF